MYPFKPGSFAPKNAWYVVGFSRDMRSDTNAVEGRRMLQAMMDAEAAA